MTRGDNLTDQDRSRGGSNSNGSNANRNDSQSQNRNNSSDSDNRDFARNDDGSRDTMMDEDSQENL